MSMVSRNGQINKKNSPVLSSVASGVGGLLGAGIYKTGCKSIALILLSFAIVFNSKADDELSKMIERVAKGSEGNSEAQAKAESAVNRILEIEDQKREQEGTIKDNAGMPKRMVIEHYKVKGGIPFPEPDKVILPVEDTLSDQVFDNAVKEVMRAQEEYARQPLSNPGRCRENNTTRTELSLGNSDKAIYDRLYLDPSMVPMDPYEVYGEAVRIVKIDLSNSTDRDLLRAYGIPCIPYRLRMTEKFEFHDTGLNAYRNYDDAQNGPGKAHVWVSKKIGQ